MKPALAFGAAACASVLFLAGAGLPRGEAEPMRAEFTRIEAVESAIPGLYTDDLPPMGECRLWYDTLARASQPAPMDCEHAVWLAERWGGRVIQSAPGGAIELGAYEGSNDFTGVPSYSLPRAGYCRAWLDGVAAEQQPEQSDCRVARRTAREQGGRVLFMPI